MTLLGHWWNGLWGTRTRKDVWLEHHHDDGRFYVRWRGGQWRDRDGVCWRTTLSKAQAVVDALTHADAADPGDNWRRVDS